MGPLIELYSLMSAIKTTGLLHHFYESAAVRLVPPKLQISPSFCLWSPKENFLWDQLWQAWNPATEWGGGVMYCMLTLPLNSQTVQHTAMFPIHPYWMKSTKTCLRILRFHPDLPPKPPNNPYQQYKPQGFSLGLLSTEHVVHLNDLIFFTLLTLS